MYNVSSEYTLHTSQFVAYEELMYHSFKSGNLRLFKEKTNSVAITNKQWYKCDFTFSKW